MTNLPETTPVVTPAELLAELRSRWPVLAEAKPLKLGIRQELRAALDGISGVRIAHALLLHIATPTYQTAVAAGGPRYALDGSLCGEVTAKQQHHAQDILDGLADWPARKPRKKPKRVKAKDKADLPQATHEPPPSPEPVKPPAVGAKGRPVLRLNPKKAGPITSVAITRKEPRP